MDTNESQSTANYLQTSGIRQNLVDTAVQFLNMDKIYSQPDSIKREFLEKKGLTHLEIDEAFKLSRNNVRFQDGTLNGSNVYIGPSESMPLTVGTQESLWVRIRNGTQTILFLAGIAFGVNYLYKQYIGPLLTGRQPVSAEDSSLEVQKAVMEVLQQIEVTLERINKNILNQNRRDHGDSTLEEIKSEMKTIKALLVNKRTFPVSPALSPSIPEWQRVSKQRSEQTKIPVENDSMADTISLKFSNDAKKGVISEGESDCIETTIETECDEISST